MGRYNLLLVDDDAAVRSMLKTVLETHGYALTTANSAADAKSKLVDGKFDLVVTDMRMETDTAGYEVVRAASAKPEPPPVVILTAFPLLAQQWREVGAHAVLSKPSRMTDLLDTIGKIIAERHGARRG